VSNARILPGVTPEEYHADPCERPSLSASIAATLVNRSPAHAWLEHPRLGGVGIEPTRAMDMGSLVHRLVLGIGPDVAVIDADDWRSKAAREARDEARAAGRLPVLRRQMQEAEAMATCLRQSLERLHPPIVLDGVSEICITWQEDSASGPVLCRAMLDQLVIDGGGRATIYDLKTTHSARPKDCERRALDMGYDIQQAAYCRGLLRARPELAGRIDFVFLFLESSPPHCVTPARLGGILEDLGEQKWRRAVEMWARCTKDNHWPGYVDGPVSLNAPPWALNEEMDREAAGA